MSQNVVINGETYENIDAIAVENESGETVLFGDGSTPIVGAMMAADYDPDNDKIFGINVGGTGASSAEKARQNLGLGKVATRNIVPIEEGGTGFNNKREALNNLINLGANPVVANDTPMDWIALGSGYVYFSSDSTVINKPSPFGVMVQVALSGIIIQKWYTVSSGVSYYRQGNATGWNGSATVTGKEAWKTCLDSTNGTQKVIVWTSENSGASMFEGGKVEELLIEYSEVEIECRVRTTVSEYARITLRRGSSGKIFFLGNSANSDQTVLYARSITVSDDGVTFGSCTSKNIVTSAVTVDDNYLIPYRIYATKGVRSL